MGQNKRLLHLLKLGISPRLIHERIEAVAMAQAKEKPQWAVWYRHQASKMHAQLNVLTGKGGKR